MTIQKCLSICRSWNFPYAGLEWSIECHCGFMPADGFQWTWSDKCDDRCSGDTNQVCGGSNALTLWTTTPDIFDDFCVYDFPGERRVLNEISTTGNNNMTPNICRDFCKGTRISILIIAYIYFENHKPKFMKS